LCLNLDVTSAPAPAPDDVAALRAALLAEQAARRAAEQRASGAEAVIAQLKLMIAKMRHERFGASSERGRKLLEQLERGIAIGRKAWLFAGSDRGGERAAAIYTLIVTAKLNGLDPRAWLADVLRRIADYPAARLDELLPWNCTERAAKLAA
jgi:transposase IS66-like protein